MGITLKVQNLENANNVVSKIENSKMYKKENNMKIIKTFKNIFLFILNFGGFYILYTVDCRIAFAIFFIVLAQMLYIQEDKKQIRKTINNEKESKF